jgi:hypothetical protein
MGLRYPREILATVSAGEPDPTEALLVDTVYFASQILEEGDPTRVAVVHDPEGAAGLAKVEATSDYEDDEEPAWDVLHLARRPFDPATLAKLARGVTYGRQLLVVGGSGYDLWIDGIARKARYSDGGMAPRVASPRPGTVVVERGSLEVLRIEGGARAPSTINVLGCNGPVRHAIGAITGDFGGGLPDGHGYSWTESALVRLLPRMRVTGCGAILAMLPFEPRDSTPRGAAILRMLDKALYRPTDHYFLKRRIDDEKSKGFAHRNHRISLVNQAADANQRRNLDRSREEHDAAKDALEARSTTWLECLRSMARSLLGRALRSMPPAA